MATINRDYGVLGNRTAPQNSFEITPRRQVYQATHEGGGATRLPFMNRSFISFTFGGKHIEDFDLIATVSGDRMERNGYAEFEDTVSSYDNLDGQYYWSTHYKTNSMDFTLATDGIEQKILDDFLYWFRAGAIRELVLAEHPNRGIMARVSESPNLSLLPFEQEVDLVVNNVHYKTKTTLYKGEITLRLVMDEPHWYSLVNILGKKVTKNGNKVYNEEWIDANGSTVNLFATQDALKIIYEDNIPTSAMIQANMLLGNGAYANVEQRIESCIWDPDSDTTMPNIIYNEGIATGNSLSGGGACINGTKNNINYKGIISGALVNASEEGIETLSVNEEAYFFYSGTAPAPTLISFELIPSFDINWYIACPNNSYSSAAGEDIHYNTITIESLTKQELKFTTPNLLTSYNKVIDIFRNNINSTYTWEQIREMIRDQVRHPAVREWAMVCIQRASGGNTNVLATSSNSDTTIDITECMSFMLKKKNSDEAYSMTFIFNSQTGEATGDFFYRKVTSSIPKNMTKAEWIKYGQFSNSPMIEDVGDMLLSNYIIIRDRNYFTDAGTVAAWTSASDKTKQYSHRMYHDVVNGLSKVQILYKNMYL